jgi:sigma-E factor negative regulatory protein RseC
MPLKEGHVVKVSDDGWAEVITARMDACADCLSSRSCHSSCKSVRMTTGVRNDAGAAVGDTVSVYIRSESVLQNAAILYLVPVAFLMTGALIGAFLSQSLELDESVSAGLFALFGIGTGFALIRHFSKRISNQSRRLPRIARIVAKAAEDPSAAKKGLGSCMASRCSGSPI